MGRIALQKTLNVTITSDRVVKPYLFPAVVTLDLLTVFSDEYHVIEQLNELNLFRQSVLNAVVRALREGKDPNCAARYAVIELRFGYEGSDGKRTIRIDQSREARRFWTLLSFLSDDKLDPRFEGAPIRLATALKIVRDLLEEQTSIWLSQVPLKGGA